MNLKTTLPKTVLLASALLIVPVSAMAQGADCGANLDRVSQQFDAQSQAFGLVRDPVPDHARSGWAITWNRMATALQDAYAATLAPDEASPTGTGQADANQLGWQTGTAHTLVQARDSLQAARAAHARSDEAACQRQVADAEALLKTLG